METSKKNESKPEKAQRFFDAVEYTNKLNAALEKLKKEKKPGEMSGKVGKAEILKNGAAQMQKLIDEGFTLKQISDAISEDVFGILPKSLTEVLQGKKERVTKRVNKTNKQTKLDKVVKSDAVAGVKPNATEKYIIGSTGSISVIEDSKDL